MFDTNEFFKKHPIEPIEVVVRKKQPKDFSIDELMSNSLPTLYIKANIEDDLDKGRYFIEWKKMLEKERERLRKVEHFEEAQRVQDKITELSFDYDIDSEPKEESGVDHFRTHEQIAYSMLEPRLRGLSPWSAQELLAEQDQKLNELKNIMEKAVIEGELKAIVEIRQPGYDDGFKEITDPNRIRKIQNGYLAENHKRRKVRLTIYRDDFRAWLEKTGHWPLPDSCALAQWFETEPPVQKKRKYEFDKRLDALKDWLIRSGYSLGNEVIILPKHYTRETIYTELCEKYGDIFLSIELNSFYTHFWKKQKIAKLLRGNKSAIL